MTARRPGVVLAAIALALLLGGAWLWPLDPLAQSAVRLANPHPAHPLGTDQYGRDLLARILAGGQVSLLGAVLVCGGTALLGLIVGGAAALGPGWLDAALSRLIEALLAIPTLVVVLGLTALLGRAFEFLLLAMIAANWPWHARIYRSLLRQEQQLPYAQAARTLGVHPAIIVTRHLLPNIAGPAIVIATAGVGANILALASLSFLGLGAQPPTAEWGLMINEARTFFQLHPWQMIAPGLAIVITVVLVNLTGDQLRDRMDPALRRVMERSA